jgi:hypothetical protein
VSEHDRIDHTECYASGLHSNTPDGRAGCRDAHRQATGEQFDSAVRDAILAAAQAAVDEGHRTMGEFMNPDEVDDPFETMDEGLGLTGVMAAVWPYGKGPRLMCDIIADGALAPVDTPDEMYVFRAGLTHGRSPFGVVVQVGRTGEAPLRTMWIDGQALTKVMIEACIAHITGEGLQYVGEGDDPRQPVTIPDTLPDALDQEGRDGS